MQTNLSRTPTGDTPNPTPSGLATFVSGQRLWDRHMELAKIGGIASGGMDRQAMTPEDTQAKAMVISWAKALGARCATDEIGNVFLTLPGTDPSLPPFMTGSHLDTQPSGGRFDGVSGVLAGLEVLEAISQSGVKPTRAVELVIWQNEEGCRFSPTTMGSGVFVGAFDLNDMLAAKDADGTSVKQALGVEQATLSLPMRAPKQNNPMAYLELHIEQGPVLESHGLPVGIATSVQGMRQYRVTLTGESGHAGTVPNAMRHDAVDAAMRLICSIRNAISDPEDLVRFTVGTFEVSPGVINTIANKATFTIDLRHPSDRCLSEIDLIIQTQSDAISACSVQIDRLIDVPAVAFDGSVISTMTDSANALGIEAMHLPSGATHDARFVAGICPSAMLFVPCRDGISHNPREWAEADHLLAGTRVLAEVTARLCETSDNNASLTENTGRQHHDE